MITLLFWIIICILVARVTPETKLSIAKTRWISYGILMLVLIIFIVLVKQDNKYQLLFPLLIATHPITLIDLNYHKIPNNLNFFLALSQTLILAIGFSFNFEINFIEGVIAGFLMTSLFLIMNALSGGQLGMGDVKLAYVLGLVTGIISYEVTVLSLLIMFLFSGLYSLLLILFGKVRRDSYIAFGPFMLFGTWMAHLLAPLFI